MLSIVEHEDELISQSGKRRIWLPTECWVDVLKLLCRRQLLRGVEPGCRRLHAISELHVPSVHIIRNFVQFLDGLERNLPKAIRQCADLSESQVALGRHFRLMSGKVELRMDPLKNKRRSRAKMCVLRHSWELFRGCQLHMALRHQMAIGGDYLAYLSLLAPARPFAIEVMQYSEESPELRPDVLLREPTILSCPKLTIYYPQYMTSAETICHWLHHLPTQQDDGELDENAIKTRIFNLATPILPSTSAEIIEHCKQTLQQAESVSDQRSFLLNLNIESYHIALPPLKLENHASGEVLHLEQHVPRQELLPIIAARPVPPPVFYRLRRCAMAELANAEKFYRDTFRNETLIFRIQMDDGLEAPKLELY